MSDMHAKAIELVADELLARLKRDDADALRQLKEMVAKELRPPQTINVFPERSAPARWPVVHPTQQHLDPTIKWGSEIYCGDPPGSFGPGIGASTIMGRANIVASN